MAAPLRRNSPVRGTGEIAAPLRSPPHRRHSLVRRTQDMPSPRFPTAYAVRTSRGPTPIRTGLRPTGLRPASYRLLSREFPYVCPEDSRSVAASRVGSARTVSGPCRHRRLGPPRLASPPRLRTRHNRPRPAGLRPPPSIAHRPPGDRLIGSVRPRIPVPGNSLSTFSSPGNSARALALGRFPSEPTSPPAGSCFSASRKSTLPQRLVDGGAREQGPRPGLRLSRSFASRSRPVLGGLRPERTPDPERVWPGPSGDGRGPRGSTPRNGPSRLGGCVPWAPLNAPPPADAPASAGPPVRCPDRLRGPDIAWLTTVTAWPSARRLSSGPRRGISRRAPGNSSFGRVPGVLNGRLTLNGSGPSRLGAAVSLGLR